MIHTSFMLLCLFDDRFTLFNKMLFVIRFTEQEKSKKTMKTFNLKRAYRGTQEQWLQSIQLYAIVNATHLRILMKMVLSKEIALGNNDH